MKKYIFTIISCALLFSSCAKELDVTPPNSITEEQIKAMLASGDEATIIKILGSMANSVVDIFNFNGIVPNSSYLTGYGYSEGQDVMRNLMGNDIVLGNKELSSSLYGAWEYQLNDVRSTASTYNYPYWYYGYDGVVVANKLLNYLTDEVVGTNKLLESYKGRGLITRAFFYNYLMENYQEAYLQGGKDKLGVPIYTKYNPSQDYQPRSSAADTYKFIKQDLQDAIKLYTDAGVGFTSDVYDLDLGVAYFILARVSLWTGDYGTCIDCCNKIIAARPNFIPEANYGNRITRNASGAIEMKAETDAFMNNSINPEVLFGWDKSKDYGIFGSYMNIFSESFGSTSSYGPTKDAYQCIDNRLYDKIAANDYRKDCFSLAAIGDYNYPTQGIHYIPAYANLKFAANYGLGTTNQKDAGKQDFCFFRTSEVWLMKAEAQLANNDETGAKLTLNSLLAARTRSGATTLTCDNYPSMSGMTTLQKIQLQWRIEMWGENGLEYYNNKRWNIPVDRTSSANHVVKSTMPVSNMTLQIPEEEMLYNSLCKQN